LFVTAVERPALLSRRDQQPGVREQGEMPRGGRRSDAELLANEIRAHAILNRVAVDLRREVSGRVLQVAQDVEPDRPGDGLQPVQVLRYQLRSFAISHKYEI